MLQLQEGAATGLGWRVGRPPCQLTWICFSNMTETRNCNIPDLQSRYESLQSNSPNFIELHEVVHLQFMAVIHIECTDLNIVHIELHINF